MTQPMREGATRSRGWVTWSSLGLGTHGVGQFVLLAVLARFLTPDEFGVMTATLVVVMIGRAMHAGIAPALVQREDLRPEHIRSGFALACLVGVALFLAMWLLAPAIAAFFVMPDELANDLIAVMRAMGLLFIVQAPGLAPEALLQREMRLRPVALAEMSGVLLGVLPVGIVCAAAGFGVWSLVMGYLAQALVKCLALVIARPHPRALLPVRGATWDLVHYSGGFIAARLCNSAATEGDKLIVGRWMTTATLGVYGRAYQLMAMPAMFLGEVVDRIVFPLLSRAQNDQASLRQSYSRGVSLVATIMAPAAAVSIALGPEIVRVVLGPQWDEVTLPFQVLMGGLVFRTGYKISDMLARAKGTVYARAWRQAVFAGLIMVCAFGGTRYGVTGVAAGVVVALAGNYLLMAQLSLRTTGLAWSRYLLLHVRGLLLAGATWAFVAATAAGLRAVTPSPLLVLLGALAIAGAVVLAATRLAPRRILGGDGLWLLSTLTGRAHV